MKKRSDPPNKANTVAEPHDFTQYYKKGGLFRKSRLGTKNTGGVQVPHDFTQYYRKGCLFKKSHLGTKSSGGVQVPHDFTQYFTKKELAAMSGRTGRRRKPNYVLEGILLLLKLAFIAALLMILIAIISPFLAPLICDAPRAPISLH